MEHKGRPEESVASTSVAGSSKEAADELVFWHMDGSPPASAKIVYLWDGYTENGTGRFSILRYCDLHGERLRSRYCCWANGLGEFLVAGRRVVDHLARADGLSVWWLSLLVEKSLWKSPAITDAIRLLAAEEIILERRPGSVRLVSPSRALHRCLGDMCRRRGIRYRSELVKSSRSVPSFARFVRDNLPHTVRALLSIARYSLARWPLRQAPRRQWFSGRNSALVCSYFFRLDPEEAQQGRHRSQYWDGLPNVFAALGISVNWLQIFLSQPVAPNPRMAVRLVTKFNRQPTGNEFHTFVESFLSWRLVSRVLRQWLHMWGIAFRLRSIARAFEPVGSSLSFWPILADDWKSSLHGACAMDSCLWIDLFDAALANIPRQRIGMYLSENQAWERAFIHAWRKHGHGTLVAVPHTTRSFWDMRFYADPGVGATTLDNRMPMADRVAVNGPAARAVFLGENHASATIVEVEALRYQQLNRTRLPRAKVETSSTVRRVLVLGDYMAGSTARMLDLLARAVLCEHGQFEFALKPHPSCPVDVTQYSSLQLQIVTHSIADAVPDYDIAYASNGTSAAVDAYLGGLPIVVMLDDKALNLSPLRGRKGVRFVGSPKELAIALVSVVVDERPTSMVTQFFNLDVDLPRWRLLLQM